MKINSLCAVSLLTVLGLSLTNGGNVLAADPAEPLVGDGTVTVEEGTTIDPTDPTPDPEKPGEVIVDPTEPGIKPNPSKGSMGIERVSTLDFGTIKTSSSKITKSAKELTWTPDGGTEQKRGAFIVFNDIRANETYGYDIQAKLTKQFTTSNENVDKTLANSEITYSNAHLDPVKGNTNVVPSIVTPSFTLSLDAAKTVVTADKAEKEGKGQYTLEFGRGATYEGTNGTADSAKDSVQLSIPSATASSMNTGTYAAEITWTMVAN